MIFTLSKTSAAEADDATATAVILQHSDATPSAAAGSTGVMRLG